jgi:uncharacterized membrane protein YagU involved in acid resistance
MHSHHFTRRMPDWRAAVIGGCVAGAVFLVLELLVMWVTGQSPWGWPRMIAAIAVGRDALAQPASFDAGIMLVALIVHFALSILFAIILAVIMAPFSLDFLAYFLLTGTLDAASLDLYERAEASA